MVVYICTKFHENILDFQENILDGIKVIEWKPFSYEKNFKGA